MSTPQVIDQSSQYADAPLSRTVILASVALYPLWHLATPSDAIDPWIVWWIVAASFFLVDFMSRRVAFVARNFSRLLYLCASLCTMQLFMLAFLNDMRPFYAIGSVMSVLSTSMFIRSKPDFIAFGLFVLVLSSVLMTLEPSSQKAAYWGGSFTIIVGAYFRLSAQLRVAEVTREHQEQLESAVKERTLELSEANRLLRREIEEKVRLEEGLRLSQKLEAVGRLAGGIAHEFNNLLTRIRLYAEFSLARVPSGSESQADIEEILNAGRQAATLTRQLLTFSRQDESNPRVVDVNDAIGESSTMLRHLLGEKINFVCDLGDESHTIFIDRGQFEQVLVNLVLNARDAMPDGGRCAIETRVVRSGDPEFRDLPESVRGQELVLVAIEDTGIGMDAETRARAFDPFFSRKPVNAGTGLGLSIVFGITDHAGGHIRISSEPGKGARFELFWPRSRELPLGMEESNRPVAELMGSECILLVEDESELRHALFRVLSANGYRVLEAKDPETAIRAAGAHEGPIELLLTDVVMPTMNGVDLADAICSNRPETRVILMSGYMDLRESLTASPPPGVDFLPKPFESDELAVKVRTVLDAKAPVRPRDEP